VIEPVPHGESGTCNTCMVICEQRCELNMYNKTATNKKAVMVTSRISSALS